MLVPPTIKLKTFTGINGHSRNKAHVLKPSLRKAKSKALIILYFLAYRYVKPFKMYLPIKKATIDPTQVPRNTVVKPTGMLFQWV